MDSILTSVKKMLGIAEEYTHFDMDLVMHINSVLSILTQLGVGPSKGFLIVDKNDKWSEFLPESITLENVKSYVYMKVRMLFDPPQSSATLESMNRLIGELEWRINVAVENSIMEDPDDPIIDNVRGIVVNCDRVNIRETPISTSPVIAQLERGTSVKVYINESTSAFYKVSANSVEGFCSKEYIAIR